MEYTLKISGMSCANCAHSIEKTVEKVDGVKQVHVNLATQTMYVDVSEDSVLEDVYAGVENAGYIADLPTQETLLKISGMSCANCARSIEKAVAQQKGVLEVVVNFATETLFVKHDDTVNVSAIAQIVEQTGYSVVDTTQVENGVDHRLRNRLIISLIFVIPLLYLAMGSHFFNAPMPSFLDNHFTMGLVQMLLSLPIMWVNRHYYTNGFKRLFNGQANMDSLVAIGTLTAFAQGFYALVVLFAGHHIDFYIESGAIILTLVTLGKYFEHTAKQKTTGAIQALVELSPKTAVKVENGQTREVPVAIIKVGDVLRAKAGEAVALDGVILSGTAQIDESFLTGESMPVTKSVDDQIIGATLVQNGSVDYTVTHVGKETTLSQIIQFVERAQSEKAPIAKLADVISGYFVPVVLVLAVLTLIGWLLVGQSVAFSLNSAVAVLIIACPCALGLATPTAIMVATGVGAKRGILVKNAPALEKLHHVNTVVLDKTGTVTYGKPVVTEYLSADETLLQKIVSVESYSNHPLAQAIVNFYEGERLSVERFEAIEGRGVCGTIDGKILMIGNEKMGYDHLGEGILTHEYVLKAREVAQDGKTPLLVMDEQSIVGLLVISDAIKPTSKKAVSALKRLNIDVVMLTGDNEKTARTIAKAVGINKVISDVLPQDKANVVKQLEETSVVAMVGDGVNDAPALAVAAVGISIGSGTQVAMETSDVVLMHSDVMDVVSAITLSKMTMRTIKTNLFWAFAYNVIGIPLAMGLFYPVVLNPMFAGLAMSFSSVSVVVNALRLNWKKID
ncbi:copper-translocating P-type ATPase [Carnobacteriaceae bacterium zg-ZUI252]|nr:copper-translocating P-type ATPase [Carnobacteriaceae bacterium zg-ZUI252]